MKQILYLASASPRRKEILEAMKLPFKIVRSKYSEKPRKISPQKLVLEHAVGKALKAVVPKTARWILGADTTVYGFGKIFGKPRSEKEAFEMLSRLNGRTHAVYTGIALLDRSNGKILTAIGKTKVVFKKWPPEKIRKYIETVPVLDKAGAYGIQLKPKIVKKIEGSYTNVVGLPKEKLLSLMKAARLS